MNLQLRETVLLLVDLQNDFLEREGLVPDPPSLCARAAKLLGAARRLGIAVVHAHTLTRADGSDRMPHWIRSGTSCCTEGSRGAETPAALAPRAGELVLRKQYFSAFADPRLEAFLRASEARRLIVAGVYLHGCVRSTVLDAYERGYEICVVDDAVGTTDPLHGEITRQYLAERAASFLPLDEVLATLGAVVEPAPPTPKMLPAAVIAGARRGSAGRAALIHCNPCRLDEVLAAVPLGSAAEVEEAAGVAEGAGRRWAQRSPAARAELLDCWAEVLESRRDSFADLIVREQGKPRRFAAEEIGRAVAHARIAAELARDPALASTRLAPGVAAAQRPLGVVGLVTPWNNPLAIPVGKIAPAIGFGNAVVLKPAPQASLLALEILASLEHAGLPPGVVNLVLGDGRAARALCRESRVAAVAATGSVRTGRVLAGLCAASLKPLQAELGGNNATIVLGDADLEAEIGNLMRAAFAFAGQRCTATRRFIVEREIAARFEALAREATESLVNGEADDPATEVGPLISAEARDNAIIAIERGTAAGARLLTGGRVPRGLQHGAWLTPALLADVDPRSALAQEETFAPIAVILIAADLDEALDIANGVPQGLVMGALTRDQTKRDHIRAAAAAGIVQLRSGPLAVHPRAPFSGWKASGLGPPEHGVWDAAFYTRTQAVYTDESC